MSEVHKAQERVCILQEELENLEEMREKVSRFIVSRRALQ